MNLGRKIIIGFIACAIVLFCVAIFSFKNTEKFVASNNLVNHSNQVLYEFEQILKSSIDAETGVRGYIITGDAIFLKPFASANSKIIEKIEKVKELTKDNSTQQKNIEELTKQFKLRLENLNKGITLRKNNFEQARTFVASREGKQIQDEIRKTIEKAQEVERTLLAQRVQESQNDASKFNFVFAVLLLVIGMILIAVYTIIATNLKALKKSESETAGKNWLLTGNAELNEKLIGDQNIIQLANSTISFLCTYMKANIGAVYLFNEKDNTLKLTGKFAFSSAKDTTEIFKLNEGLIGQAAWEQKQISLTDISEDQIRITSSVLNAKPKNLLITPILLDGRTIGVIEIGKLSDFTETEKEFINVSMRSIAISINTVQQAEEKELRAAELAIANNELAYQNDEKEKRAAELAIANEELAYQNEEKEKRAVELSFANKELSNQAEELQIQQEELRQLNEELEQQAQNLKQQQEELQMTNEELEEQTQSLEEKNKEVEASKNDIEKKTKQLEISSKYKSEFLANMSHELRTPLNSLLILSKDLSENRKKNLDEVQVESAEIIYKSGHDLLVLINEVLDLSKIEAGKMNVNIEKVYIKNFSHNLLRDFKHQAEQKGLTILCELASNLPDFIHTDSQRLNQILKNLLSNAIKFTENGSVIIRIELYTETTLNISVSDTGIGISEDKQSAIFEAFQQAEGGTSRKYGGTGLGLSISRELAKLLEGEIKVDSNLDQGSTFSLIIPLAIYPVQEAEQEIPIQPISSPRRPENDVKYLNYPTIQDDREVINADDKIVLIIEDDRNFAAILLKQANKKGFKCLSASSGEDGLLLAAKYKPQAIILDMGLPGIKGKQVLHELKVNPSVRHIPVHIISANDRSLEPIREGAVEYLMKPIAKDELEQAFNRIENFVDRKIKKLLIIEDSENSRKAMKILIGTGDVECYEAATGKEAIAIFENNHIDCIILDIGLPDMTGFELIHTLGEMKGHNLPPIIVYTGKELSKEENNLLHKYSDSIIIKGIKSEERLLDETALFLHRTISNLPKSKQIMIHNLHDKEAIFQSKKILLVDDDMRNVFALSKILQERGMEVIKSEDGKNALNMLEVHSDIDLVLMDIMMPEMDGYEAMKRIRSQIKFRNLPIIALTAKAMKDDKQKCIDAGANDYITKPIDVDRLLSLMRVWLSK
ncbi:response regulator [Flavobacterium sp. Sr18]|uniref:response regulator n=1 Tax=Flavobacterium sp. Sr18 TaxID=935222 RepID=UPI0013E42C6C|nr:response regulator [Flavobacterium sp. Sr18]QIH37504.1 response regulator [Flavobacterium sp. Sr18]